MKKAFSLLEIIIVIVLISIISIFAFPKLFLNITNASYAKIKSDVSLIRSAIVYNRNQNIISGKGEAYIQFLDNAKINTSNEKLFLGINDEEMLKYPIISISSEKIEIGKWIKTSENNYKIYINNLESVEFIYDSTKGTFDCNYDEELCKDLNK